MTLSAPRDFRGIFRQDAPARAVYSESAGIQRIDPLAVAVPVDVEDLQTLVNWARSANVPLIPRGSGSSMSGAAVGRGVIVDLSRWKSIDTSRLDDGVVTVGPGAICNDVNAAVRSAGLRVAVDPSSAAFCTIGGMTATNAAGAHTLALGSMREWVNGIDCVFADGSRQWVRRGMALATAGPLFEIHELLADPNTVAQFAAAMHTGVRKDSSGYATPRFARSGDVLDLLPGSEGTLAFFAKIEVRLAVLPAASASVMGVFGSLEAATEAAIRAREGGAVACELLDKTFLDFVATGTGKNFDSGTDAILLAEVEGENAQSASDGAGALAAVFTRSGATEVRVAVTVEECEMIWALRHAASPTLARMSPHLRSMQFIEDGAVPPERLGAYVAGVRAALDRHQIRGVIFGHAGDANVHVNPMIDPGSPGWRSAIDGLLDECTTLIALHGGTISGEHGDGRIRSPMLHRVWNSQAQEAFALVKHAFDPTGILNPGVKTAPDSSPWPIKYDPSLPPHPEPAARALAHVDRSRAYSSFRLELLNQM